MRNLPYDFGKKTGAKIIGGFGSGNRHRFDKKTTTGEAQSLDVRYLHREGLLKPWLSFSLRWSRAGRETGSVGAVVEGPRGDLPEWVVLSYRHGGGAGSKSEDIKESVPLEWTPGNFGGARPWFLCPGVGCGRRVAVLYGPGRYFLCRHCYDLRYESQRENGTHRALRRAQKIRERLGGSANMTEPFPERPKGMHHDTYMKLFRKYDEAHAEELAGMREWLDKLQRRIG